MARSMIGSLARTFTLFSSTNVLYFVVQLGLNIYITRTLGPEQFGLWALCLTITSISIILFSFRTNEPFSRYLTEFRLAKQKDKEIKLFRAIFLLELILRLLCYPILWIVIGFLGTYVFKSNSAVGIAVVRLYALTVICDVFGEIWFSVLREDNKIQRFALFQFLMGLITLASTIAVHVYYGLTLHGLAIVYVSVKGLMFVYLICYFFVYFRKKYNLNFFFLLTSGSLSTLTEIKSFFTFAVFTYINSTLNEIVKHIDIIIINQFVSLREVGIYKLARSLFSYVAQFGTFLAKILYQNFNELIFDEKNIKVLWSYLQKILLAWGSLIAIEAGLCWLFLDDFIHYAYGEDFIDTYQLFMLVGIGMFLAIILMPFRPLIYTLKKFKLVFFINAFVLVGYFISIYFLAPLYGVKAVSVVQGLYFFVNNLIITSISFYYIKTMVNRYSNS